MNSPISFCLNIRNTEVFLSSTQLKHGVRCHSVALHTHTLSIDVCSRFFSFLVYAVQSSVKTHFIIVMSQKQNSNWIFQLVRTQQVGIEYSDINAKNEQQAVPSTHKQTPLSHLMSFINLHFSLQHRFIEIGSACAIQKKMDKREKRTYYRVLDFPIDNPIVSQCNMIWYHHLDA